MYVNIYVNICLTHFRFVRGKTVFPCMVVFRTADLPCHVFVKLCNVFAFAHATPKKGTWAFQFSIQKNPQSVLCNGNSSRHVFSEWRFNWWSCVKIRDECKTKNQKTQSWTTIVWESDPFMEKTPKPSNQVNLLHCQKTRAMDWPQVGKPNFPFHR